MPEVRRIKEAMQEAAHYYSRSIGARPQLNSWTWAEWPVNYDGRSTAFSVDHYSLRSMPTAPSDHLKEVCEEQDWLNPHSSSPSPAAQSWRITCADRQRLASAAAPVMLYRKSWFRQPASAATRLWETSPISGKSLPRGSCTMRLLRNQISMAVQSRPCQPGRARTGG